MEIVEVVVFSVDGREFNTREAAQAHLDATKVAGRLADFLYAFTNLPRNDADDAAKCLIPRWAELRELITGSNPK